MIVILNCGSNWLSRRIGKYIEISGGTYSILPYSNERSNQTLSAIRNHRPEGLIFTGSNDHLYNPGARQLPQEFGQWLVAEKIPTLGICYGHQLLASMFGADIIRNPAGFEFGNKHLTIQKETFPLFAGLAPPFKAMMAHFDVILRLPDVFRNFASTFKTPYAVIQYTKSETPLPLFGVQFHPEISPKNVAKVFFANFLEVCRSTNR
jgi:GMP synthase (glutamine-hydrolysing)